MKSGADTRAFEAYLDGLCELLGHADRGAGLRGYCHGLMMPLERKSLEPMAAHLDPWGALATPGAASLRGEVDVVG